MRERGWSILDFVKRFPDGVSMTEILRREADDQIEARAAITDLINRDIVLITLDRNGNKIIKHNKATAR